MASSCLIARHASEAQQKIIAATVLPNVAPRQNVITDGHREKPLDLPDVFGNPPGADPRDRAVLPPVQQIPRRLTFFNEEVVRNVDRAVVVAAAVATCTTPVAPALALCVCVCLCVCASVCLCLCVTPKLGNGASSCGDRLLVAFSALERLRISLVCLPLRFYCYRGAIPDAVGTLWCLKMYRTYKK